MGLTQLNFAPNLGSPEVLIDKAGRNKVELAIMRLQTFEPLEGYSLAFSGGKDSIVIYDLAKRAGVRFLPYYNWTGIDPPQLIRFVQRHYPEVEIRKPRKTMWQLIEEHQILTTRRIRFCCEDLKERGNVGTIITGVRWQESPMRRKRAMAEISYKYKGVKFVHPIIDWGESDIWEYIKGITRLPYCELYDMGFKRLGCVLCPYTNGRALELELRLFPKHVLMWRHACERLFRHGHIPKGCQSPEELFDWWLSREHYRGKDEAQCSFFI